MMTESAPQGTYDDSFSAEDKIILDSVDAFHADGLALQKWWEETNAVDSYAQRFDLVHTYSKPDRSFGFFDSIELATGPHPIMGVVDEVFYDRPKAGGRASAVSADWMREQICEFVLRYFMRVSHFRLSEKIVEDAATPMPSYLKALSWKPEAEIIRKGMEFSQCFYKEKVTGHIGRFDPETAKAVTDLRQIGDVYEWVVVKLRVFDFTVRMKPFGPKGPELAMPLDEQTYLVMSPAFITNRENPEPGVLGEYGFGYAFVKNAQRGPFGYGPGEFAHACQTINFRVMEDGETRVRMAFVSNMPDKIVNLPFDPVNLSVSIADRLTFGLGSRLMEGMRLGLDGVPTGDGEMDPVLASIALINLLTNGQAAKQLDISRDQLNKGFLVQHSMQHYQTIQGSLRTWRQIPNWLNKEDLPEWVVSGASS